MESEESLQYGMQRFIKLKSVNRVIVANIQTIKSVAKGAKRKKKTKMDYKIMYIMCYKIKPKPKNQQGKKGQKETQPHILPLHPFCLKLFLPVACTSVSLEVQVSLCYR